MSSSPRVQTEPRDYYAVLGAEPSSTTAELRVAFRDAVLRHHPDRVPASEMATRRTAALNRAWSELRDPLRRLHYDRALEDGRAGTVEWPLDEGEAPAPRRRRTRRVRQVEPSPWHQPQWRSVAGFRVPAEVFMAGPAAQRRWIVEHHVAGEDWRQHHERYWLRFASEHYRDRGLAEDWLGSLERLTQLEPNFDSVVSVGLADAYLATHQELRGAAQLSRLGESYAIGSPQRRWADREVRTLLSAYRERHVRRGRSVERAENAELLLNFLESLGMPPAFQDLRAAIAAHRRAGHHGRAAELVERAVAAGLVDGGQIFGVVQLLTEAGQLDRASSLLAEIARGDRPEALDPRRVVGRPSRRIAAARERLARARRRAAGNGTRAASAG
jgi:curved DNA-binding protein CbpA